jgi:DNA primase
LLGIKRRLSGIDLLDPKQKRQAVEIVSDVLKIIDDAVVRDEYVKRYSVLLGVSEETLRSKAARNLWYNLNAKSLLKTEPGKLRELSAEEVEGSFFSLLYRDFKGRIERALENLQPQHFFDDIYKLIYAEIQSAPEECATVSGLVERVRNKIGEDAVRRLSPYLIDLGDSKEEDERIFDELIVYLKERLIKRKISEIRLKILEAEARGDVEAALSYARKQQELVNLLRGRKSKILER